MDTQTPAPAEIEADRNALGRWLLDEPDTESVAHFTPGPGIKRLNMRFDIGLLREALAAALERVTFAGPVDGRIRSVLPDASPRC